MTFDFAIYAICFGAGLVFTIATAVLGHLFGGHGGDAGIGTGGHAEAGMDSSGVPGISVFSPTVIAAFITSVGGLGMIFCSFDATKSPLLSAPLSVFGGLMLAGALVWMFRAIFRRTESSSEAHVADLVGVSATIITPIPANGVGEIAYVHAGTRYTAPARNERATSGLANGQTVKIVRVVGSQFYVQPV